MHLSNIFYIFIISSFLFFSCTKEAYEESYNNSNSDTELQTKNTNYNISINDIYQYLTATEKSITKSDIQINPYIYQNDTAFYEVRINNRYKLFSTDKRLPAIVAFTDESSNINIEQNHAFQDWIRSEAINIQYFKNYYRDSIITNRNTRMWDIISSKYRALTKAEGDPYESEEDGYWRLVSIDTTAIDSEIVGHLITTHWGQNAPFNECCPYNMTYTTKDPAGCVAVAGAQMLFYLHEKYDVPKTLFSIGSCTGWSESKNSKDYTFTFGSRTENAWDLIENGIASQIAILLGWVGYSVDMEYTPNGSGANTEDLVDFYDSEGISCTCKTYDGLTVFDRIFKSNEPVIVSSSIEYTNGDSGRHAYIIDKARLITYTTSRLYEYVPYFAGGVSTGETKTETETLEQKYLSMNFGWGQAIPYGSNQYQYYPSSYDNIYVYIMFQDFDNFTIPTENRYMIYNFSKK